MSPYPLDGKRALVGGGSRGIGRGCAIALAEAGSAVTVMARDAGVLAEVVAALPTPAGQVHSYLTLDSVDWSAVGEAVTADVAANGIIEILVHNTGGPPPGLAIDAAAAEFEAGFAVHVLSGQVLAASVVPGMKERGYGRIITITSTSVITPLPNLGVSNTIRGAVAQWSRTLGTELAPHGITVNNILPGSIDTDRLRTTMRGVADRTGRTVEEIAADTVAAIPVGRLGVPADIGPVVAFLASPDAGYLTGVNLAVDGGKTAVQ